MRHGESLVRRAQGARDEARLFGRLSRELVRHRARDFGRCQIDFVGFVLQVVIGLRYGRAVERVGFEDVGACFEKCPMDIRDELRLRDGKQVVIPLQGVWMVFELLAAKILFAQTVALNHRSHGAIEHHDAAI